MSVTLACMAGGPLFRVLQSGALRAKELPSRDTPFGESEQILLAQDVPVPFYLVPRQLADRRRLAPSNINYRATLYALTDLGVRGVLNWSAAGAIKHNYPLGHTIVPDDVIDMTRRRPTTFFETSGLGLLRQFPVFCPAMREAVEGVLAEQGVPVHAGGTVAVMEGPRLETPAEVRMLATMGAELVTHNLVPEAFLAKELQMCFAGVCYLVNYAETGSRHRPFSGNDLFGGLTQGTDADRIARITEGLPEVMAKLAELCESRASDCECGQAVADQAAAEGLGPDWRKWLE